MADDFGDFMDIDDEYILQDITSQIVEFRKDNVLETHYEGSLTMQDPTAEQVSEELHSSVVVVDTNFLISHLAFLKTLVFEHAKRHKLLIIIPWIVLQELDGLKSAFWKNKSSSSQHEVGNLAQTAIKFLHSCLINNEKGLRGQKIDERIETAENNDDKILDCCRYFQMVSQCYIVLLSNDKNLCVKAMVHEITTASYQKSKGLDSVLEKILSKEKFSSDGVQDNEVIPWENFPNESNTITKPKYNNGKLGSGFVQDDTMMMDCDDIPPDSSSSAQNQVPTYEVRAQSSSISSATIMIPEYSSLYDSIHAPKNKGTTSDPSSTVSSVTCSAILTQNNCNSSLYGSIHAPRSNSIGSPSSTSIKYSAVLTQNNYNPEYSSLDDSIHAPKNKRDSIGAISNKYDDSGLVSQGAILQILNDKNKRKESIRISPTLPECILSRRIELSQEYLVTKIISDLNNLLPPAISFHFQKCFNDHWTYVVEVPQPWSLSTMLKFMERYWFTVFSEIFQGINIETIKNMISFISRWENHKRANFIIEDIMQFVENSEIILMMIYDGVQWNNKSIIETKQITKSWWNEFQSSLHKM